MSRGTKVDLRRVVASGMPLRVSWSIDGNGDGVADIQRQSPLRGQAVFDAAWVDRATGREMRRLPQRAGLAWFAELPSRDCAVQAPLTLAVPNGVRRQ